MGKIIINESYLDKKLTGIPRMGYEIIKKLLNYDDVYLLSSTNNHHFTEDKVLTTGKSNDNYKLVNLFNKQRYINNIDRNDKLLHLGSMLPVKKQNMFLTLHDMSVFDHPEWFKPSFVWQNKIMIRHILKYAKKIFTISEFSKNRIIKHLKIDENSIVVIQCGVSKIFSPKSENSINEIRRKYNLPQNYILFLSSLEPRKNIKNLLKAWSAIDKDKKNKYGLVIAGGKGKVFSDINISNAGYDTSDIIYTGYFDDKELPILYSGARGFIYPSFYEGFGIPPLEAMACGTPTIVSDTTSLPEVVGEASLFINPYDVKTIVDAIQIIINDKNKRTELSKRGILQAKKFNWSNAARKIYNTISVINY
jgi:glycosyltransferase involved in cell wall biosynthesis